jgi:hypothetical protein
MINKRDYSGVPKLERCGLAESIFVEYPRFTNIVNQVAHCHTYSQVAAEPECMFIGGPPGAGKTTLQNHYLRRFPRSDRGDVIHIPVLCGRVPNRATDKTLVTELLLRLEDLAAEKGSSHNQTTRLRRFIKDCGVKLIILDEFQHFLDKDSWKVLKTVSDWLKNLIDEAEVPIVLIGMPYAAQILDAPGNEQLQRRFAVRATLAPFGWGTKEERSEFRAFLKIVDEKLPLNEPSRLSDPLTAFRFYCATNGRVGKVMKIVRRATELALDQCLEYLPLDVLADAYNDRLRADCPERDNPFHGEKADLKITPFVEPELSFAAMSARSRKLAKGRRASSVLSKKGT